MVATPTLFPLADVVAQPPSGSAATDRAMLIQAISDTPAGGTLHIPGHATDKTTPYLIDQALVVSKHIVIQGRDLCELWLPEGAGGDVDTPSGLSGTVIKQVTAATDIFQLSGSAKSVWMSNLGLTFDSAIADTNTGHGINAFPSLVYSSGHDSGVMGSKFENISVKGHDGNHYAFQFRNTLYVELNHLRAYGGGGLLLDCDSYASNYGNMLIVAFFNKLVNSGTADAIKLVSRTHGGVSGLLNFLFFIRLQVNIGGAASTAGTQKFFNANGGGALPRNVLLDNPDFEGFGANPIDFGGQGSGVTIRNPASIAIAPTGGYDSASPDYRAFTTAGAATWVCPDGVTRVRVRSVGGGGGGGGGGTNAAAAQNAGGGGGAAGAVTEEFTSVTPGTSYAITVGAAGTGGNGGTAGGNPGAAGTGGGQTNFANVVLANGGAAGAGGGANSGTGVGGGVHAQGGTFSTTTALIPGNGGPSSQASIPLNGAVGGAGGGSSNTTNGGGGGGAWTQAFPAYGINGAGGAGGSGTANGVAGTTATARGSGGGGGGGAPSGGAGGNGGAGAPGMVEIWW